MSRPELTAAMLAGIEIHSGGIDYLRATSVSRAGAEYVLETWNRHKQILERLGDRTKKGGLQGFTGLSCGPLFFGRKDEMFMLQASGSLAGDLWPGVPWEHMRCARIDLQVTYQTPEWREPVAEILGGERAARFKRQGRKMKPTQNLRKGWGAGDTLYIGSRVSSRFGRLYDKGLQSKDERFERCWRWEVEYKNEVAPKIVDFLLSQPHIEDAIIAAVKGQYDEWGIACPIQSPGILVAGSIGRRDFDLERSVGWLTTQVRPTIERLAAHMSNEEIRALLGLQEFGEPEWSGLGEYEGSQAFKDIKHEWSGYPHLVDIAT